MQKHSFIALAAGAALAATAFAPGANAASMSFEFLEVGKVIDRTTNDDFTDETQGFSGGVWNDPNGDVVGLHNFSTDGSSTNPDIQNTPLERFFLETEGNGTVAAQWAFTVTGSTGDDWDAILSSSLPVQFDAMWDGNLLNDATGEGPASLIPMGALFFSHIFADGAAALASLDTWVFNNNSASTPGATLPVWTYLFIDDIDNLTGSSGVFAAVAQDSDDILGLNAALNGGAAFIGTEGSGELNATVVPVPAALPLLLTGIAGLGLVRVLRRRQAA